MSGYFDQSDDDEDDGLEHLRQKHHQELSAKHNQFLQMQHEIHQAHLGNAQQALQAKIAMAEYHHQAQMAAIHAGSARQAVEMHQVLGEKALRGALNDAMANGQDPQYLRQVAYQLRQNGRGDLADIHDETASGWE